MGLRTGEGSTWMRRPCLQCEPWQYTVRSWEHVNNMYVLCLDLFYFHILCLIVSSFARCCKRFGIICFGVSCDRKLLQVRYAICVGNIICERIVKMCWFSYLLLHVTTITYISLHWMSINSSNCFLKVFLKGTGECTDAQILSYVHQCASCKTDIFLWSRVQHSIKFPVIGSLFFLCLSLCSITMTMHVKTIVERSVLSMNNYCDICIYQSRGSFKKDLLWICNNWDLIVITFLTELRWIQPVVFEHLPVASSQVCWCLVNFINVSTVSKSVIEASYYALYGLTVNFQK